MDEYSDHGGPEVTGFVIEYNRRSGTRRVVSFGGTNGPREALRERLRLDGTRSDPDIEIVSFSANSLEELEATHSRYFAGPDASAA
jgi:hypothetical protein